MKKITTTQLKKDYESHYGHTYETDLEFRQAVEVDYHIDENENGECVFSSAIHDEPDFIVTDFYE